tara:strand:- start:3042 stop:3443 length:402 start_codon:yes stop_codon:yes gene_type:complete
MKLTKSQLRQIIREEILKEGLSLEETQITRGILINHVFELLTTNDADKPEVAQKILDEMKAAGVPIIEGYEEEFKGMIAKSMSYFNGGSLQKKRDYVVIDEEKFVDEFLIDSIDWLWPQSMRTTAVHRGRKQS